MKNTVVIILTAYHIKITLQCKVFFLILFESKCRKKKLLKRACSMSKNLVAENEDFSRLCH